MHFSGERSHRAFFSFGLYLRSHGLPPSGNVSHPPIPCSRFRIHSSVMNRGSAGCRATLLFCTFLWHFLFTMCGALRGIFVQPIWLDRSSTHQHGVKSEHLLGVQPQTFIISTRNRASYLARLFSNPRRHVCGTSRLVPSRAFFFRGVVVGLVPPFGFSYIYLYSIPPSLTLPSLTFFSIPNRSS